MPPLCASPSACRIREDLLVSSVLALSAVEPGANGEDAAVVVGFGEEVELAGVIVYENLWAAPFASAARRSGGQLIANGRIPIHAIIATVEADEALEAEGA